MSDMSGRMSGFLRGLDDWLLREDPDVCADGAAEMEWADDGDETSADADAIAH